ASFARGNFTPGINQLQAFQNKVRAQIGPQDNALADNLIQAVQKIIDAIQNPLIAPRRGSQLRLTSSQHVPAGKLRFSILSAPGQSYAIQASTDLIHWTTLTNCVSPTGTNQFIDATGTGSSRRFYRATSP